MTTALPPMRSQPQLIPNAGTAGGWPAVNPERIAPANLAAARTDMKEILAREPELGDFGFGVFRPSTKTKIQQARELIKERQEICTEQSLAGFIVARAWLRQFSKISRFNLTGTSYGLKHVAEKEIGYITNGVLIAAAIAEGFRVRRVQSDSPNAVFNISAAAWTRKRKATDGADNRRPRSYSLRSR